jgi:hypothetical protein
VTTKQEQPDLADFGEIPDPLAAEEARRVPPRAADLAVEAPERGVVRARRAAALCVSLAWLGVHLAVYGVRTDLMSLPLLYAATQILVPIALAFTALAVATGPGKLGLGPSISVVVTLAVLGPASFVLIALGAPIPRAPLASEGSLWLGALVCLDITLVWAAVPLLVAALSLRHAFPVASRWRAATVGGSCGLVSGAVMNLHCPNVDPFHIALGHGIPVIVATVIGAVLMSRWVRI